MQNKNFQPVGTGKCDGCRLSGMILVQFGQFRMCAACLGTPHTSPQFPRIQQNLMAKVNGLRQSGCQNCGD